MDREALIAIADSYLDALTSRDPSRVPLAPDVTRTDHGRVVADNAERIRAYAATTPSRDDVIAVAGRYLNALVSHVGSDVPLAPEALRIENGHNRGDGGEAIAAALELEIMHTVSGITDIRWYVEGDTGIEAVIGAEM